LSWGGRVQPQAFETASLRKSHLQGHQVDAGDLLGDRVFDLQAWIGLDEDEVGLHALLVFLDEELEGPQALVFHLGSQLLGRGENARAQLRREHGAGCNLDHFLKAALQCAVAVAERHDMDAVSRDLHFDMARAIDESLRIQCIDAKRRHRLGTATGVKLRDLGAGLDDAHAAAPAAAHRLDDDSHGALFVKESADLLERGAAVRGGHDRDFAFPGELQRCALVTEQRQMLDGRADECDSCFCAGQGEIGSLAEKAVARMNRVALLALGGGNDGADIDIGGRSSAGQRHGRIRHDAMLGVRVVAGVDGNAFNAHITRCTQDANGNLATVCNQNSFHCFPDACLEDVTAQCGAVRRKGDGRLGSPRARAAPA